MREAIPHLLRDHPFYTDDAQERRRRFETRDFEEEARAAKRSGVVAVIATLAICAALSFLPHMHRHHHHETLVAQTSQSAPR